MSQYRRITHFVEFPSFETASRFASWATRQRRYEKLEIPVRRVGDVFKVGLYGSLELEMACRYIYETCRGFVPKKVGPAILAALQPEHYEKLRSLAAVWTDPLSGLTWDVARYFMLGTHSEHPDNASDLMNEVHYGGCNDWRLPTRDEIKTLSSERFLNLGLLDHRDLVAYRQWMLDRKAGIRKTVSQPLMLNIWSSEILGDPDDYIAVNLHDLTWFSQKYSEDDRRYRHWAQTVMVR